MEVELLTANPSPFQFPQGFHLEVLLGVLCMGWGRALYWVSHFDLPKQVYKYRHKPFFTVHMWQLGLKIYFSVLVSTYFFAYSDVLETI